MSRVRLSQAGLLAVLAGLFVACPLVFLDQAGPDRVMGTCLSADGRLLARSTDRGLAVFDVHAGVALGHLAGAGHVAFSQDGRLLACGDTASLTVWDWRRGRPLFSHSGKNRWSFRVAMSPDGLRVAGADDISLRVWDLGTGDLRLTIPLTHEYDSLAFSPDGRLVVAGGTGVKAEGNGSHEVRSWTVPEGELHATLVGPEYCLVKAVAVSPDGRTVATGLSTGSVRLWDLGGRKELWKADGVAVDYGTLAFSADGGRLLAAGWGAATAFDLGRPGAREEVSVPRGPIGAVAAGAAPAEFLLATGDRVYAVDAARGDIAVVGHGLTLRTTVPVWAVGGAFAIWAFSWTFALGRALRLVPAESVAAEGYAWGVVLATACCTAAHWGALLDLAWGEWKGADPITAFGGLATLWLAALGVLVVAGILRGRPPMALACSALCVVAAVGQMIFDLYCLTAAVASV